MQACPTNAIQPDLSPARLTGLFAPEMVMRLGGCDPACTRCGEVCPTGAIVPLTPEAKRVWMIGTAVVEAERCARTRSTGAETDGVGEDCRACLEVCPYEAFETALLPGQAPRVIPDRCTGCGLCELRCPVPPRDGTRRSRRLALSRGASSRAAIRVVTVEEAARRAPAVRPVPPTRDDSHLPLFLRGS
jgi:ferredoxin